MKEHLEELDRLMHRYNNSVIQGIYTMDESVDLFMKDSDKLWDEYKKEFYASYEPTKIPEGYEIWKYDIETFEPIFRKKQ